jgi:threonine synthase
MTGKLSGRSLEVYLGDLNMILLSTRNCKERLEAAEAVLRGIAPDGGLYVPSFFPDIKMMGDIIDLNYPQLAAEILALFFENITGLPDLTAKAYSRFDDKDVAPVKKISDNEYVMELWHGPTLAFKDLALSVLPGLMAASMGGKNILILVATSGDTGKAALEGFSDAPGIKIMVFYPDGGVSDMQRLQMVTQEGANTYVVAVRGNFDEAQSGVKEIFADRDFAALAGKKGYMLSSANSINFGRLAPQIAYYIWAWAQLKQRGELKSGEKINFAVPTGNFGNILAAYYAKRMGLPVNKLICASNMNNVLTDFFNRGEYSIKREFHKTMSPSMDILISSNLERLLFEFAGRDEDAVKYMMSRLKKEGVYAIDGNARRELKKDFFADWCGEDETMACIRNTFNEKGYLLDTHTAVAAGVYAKYKKTGDETKTVLVSTASPYKFPKDVLASLGENTDGLDIFDMSERLGRITGTKVPRQIIELKEKRVRHSRIVDKGDLPEAVLEVI